MKNTKLYLSMALISLTLAVFSSASMIIPANENAKDNSAAPAHSPVIGVNWDLIRVDYIHYAKPAHPVKPTKTTTCYKLLGYKWAALPVNYAINPLNPQGLSESFVTSSISKSAETWDVETGAELFNDAYSVDYNASYGVQDYKNSIAFGDYADGNVIAVTSIWYTRVGKRLVEFDMLFDTDFVWGDASINPALMDLENIATHELGHAVGLGDIYTDSCSYVTMYGYSWEGDLAKRSLEQPDITGLESMYGA